jgi:hypothetical protein
LLILDSVTAKIIYLGFLASYTSGVAPIIQISIKRGAGCLLIIFFGLFIVFCVVSCLILGLVLGIKSVLDSGLGSLNILFIVKY